MLRLRSLLPVLLLCGCAHVDVGQVDYRVADPAETNQCRQPPCGNLNQKYNSTDSQIEEGEFYSVEILQAFVGPNISEGRFFGRNYGKHAEMAILGHVFEFDDKTSFVEIPDYDVKTTDDKPRLKLVYYGDDLEREQPFNFSNAPVLGRRRYNGGRIGIQIVIKEIDAEGSPAVQSLLETLAGFGRSVSPVPQVTDVLLDLGTSLVQGNKDDRLFDYRFTLSSAAAILPSGDLNPKAAFVPGRYVLMKSRERQTDMNWNSLRYNSNTGRLVDSSGAEFRKDLYVIMNISRYSKKSSADNYSSTDWADFREKLPSAAADSSIPLIRITEDFAQMIGADRSARIKAATLKKWARVDEAIGLYVARSLDLDENALGACADVKERLKLERDSRRRQMRDGVREFLAAYADAIKPLADKDGKEVYALRPGDQESIVSAVARTYMPWNGEIAEESFADAAKFKAAYVDTKDVTTLAKAAETIADRKAPAAVCPIR